MTERRRITIFDTTLRDGEQSPGASMNLTEKLEIAQSLQDLGVDVLEAGFPIASPGDFEAVREIAGSIHNTTVCGLARCNSKDIDRAWEALKIAERAADPRLPGDQRDPPRIQVENVVRRDRGPGGGGREASGWILRRRRVLARRRRAHRTRFPVPSGGSGDRCRRDHDQYSRHGRLCHARQDGRDDCHAVESRTQHRQGRYQHPLPQRSRTWPLPTAWRQSPTGLDRSSARSMGSANGRATARWKKS